MDSLLTLPEFAEAAAHAVEASGALPDNRQAKAVPAARMVRYYTARGLLPRPGTRGRALVYGRRHLLQLVAIKRLQGQGMALDEIAERLMDISEADLEGLAAVAEGVVPVNLGEVESAPTKGTSRTSGRFWDASLIETGPDAAVPETAAPDGRRPARIRSVNTAPPSGTEVAVAAKTVIELRLSDSIRLLVDGDCGEMPSLDALRAAAGPLLGLLAPKPAAPKRRER